jgi:hypothetical protein
MHFWNLTIDTVSCIDLVLAIGLCVDYAAHIGMLPSCTVVTSLIQRSIKLTNLIFK